MNRKEGYYWIKFAGYWQPAYWNHILSKWRVVGLDLSISNREIIEINETQILPPNNCVEPNNPFKCKVCGDIVPLDSDYCGGDKCKTIK